MNKIIFNLSIRNSFYNVIDVAVSPVLMLIVTPVLLRNLLVEGYAIWALINSIIASLSIFNFGGTSVVIKYVASYRERNIEKINGVFSTVFSFQLIISIMIYTIFIIVAGVLMDKSSESAIQVIKILYIAIPIFFVKQSEQLLYAYFKGYEEFNFSTLYSSCSKLIFFSTQLLVAVITKSIYFVFYYTLLISTIILVLQIILLKNKYNKVNFIKDANFNSAKHIFNFGGWNWLSSLASALNVHSDKWIVTSILGIKTFGLYSLGILVFNQLHNILAASIAWVFPNISYNKLNKDKLVKRFWRLMILIIIGSYFISFFLSYFNFIFSFWLSHPIYEQAKHYIDIFLIMFPVFTLSIVSYYYLLGLGLVREKFFADLFVASIKIVLIYIIIDYFYLSNWPLVFLVFISFEFIQYVRILNKAISISLTRSYFLLIVQNIVVILRVHYIF